MLNFDGVVVPRKSEFYVKAHTPCLVAFLSLSDFNGIALFNSRAQQLDHCVEGCSE